MVEHLIPVVAASMQKKKKNLTACHCKAVILMIGKTVYVAFSKLYSFQRDMVTACLTLQLQIT